MFAIISHKGNQYRLEPEKSAKIDFLGYNAKEGEKIKFEEVLLISDDKKTSLGSPILKNCSVEVEVVGETKEDKQTALKFHSKKRYKRNLGHRQKKTVVKVIKISQK